MRGVFWVIIFLVVLSGFGNFGCGSDDLMDTLNVNVEIERTIIYHDPDTNEDITAYIKISGKDATYSDSLGNSGTGVFENETVTAQFSGPTYGSGTVTVNFYNNYQHYEGTIQFDDGEVVNFSE